MNSSKLCLLAVVGLVACTPGANPTDGGVIDTRSDGEKYADLFIHLFSDCGAFGGGFIQEAEPAYVAALTPDIAAMRDDIIAGFEAQKQNPRIHYDGDAFAACIAYFDGDDGCDAFAAAVATDEDPSRCSEIFVGIQEVGDACGDGAECVDHAYCASVDDACGTCTASAQLDEDCTTAVCDDGLHCGPASVCVADTTTEAPTYAVGDPCDLVEGGCGSVYESGFVCVVDGDAGTAGHCAAAIVSDVGDPCDLAEPRLHLCKDSLTRTQCDATNNTCAARPGLNESCATPPFTSCDATVATCVDGTCVAPTPAGAACDPADATQPDCALGTSCDTTEDDAGTACLSVVDFTLFAEIKDCP